MQEIYWLSGLEGKARTQDETGDQHSDLERGAMLSCSTEGICPYTALLLLYFTHI